MIVLGRILLKKTKGLDMQVYQTNELNPYQWEQMKKFLDEEIGTDFEVDNSEPNVFCVTVFDLTSKEVGKIRDFENNRLDEPYEKFCVVFGERDNARPLRTEWFDDYEDAEQKLAEINTHFRDERGERRFWGSIESSMPSQQYQRLNGGYSVRAALNVDSEEAIARGGDNFNERVEKALLRTHYVSDFYCTEAGEVFGGGEVYELNGLLGFGHEHEICKIPLHLFEEGFLRSFSDDEGMAHYLQTHMDMTFVKKLYPSEEAAEKALGKLVEDLNGTMAALAAKAVAGFLDDASCAKEEVKDFS